MDPSQRSSLPPQRRPRNFSQPTYSWDRNPPAHQSNHVSHRSLTGPPTPQWESTSGLPRLPSATQEEPTASGVNNPSTTRSLSNGSSKSYKTIDEDTLANSRDAAVQANFPPGPIPSAVPRLQPVYDGHRHYLARRQGVLRPSSLRIETRSDDDLLQPVIPSALVHSASDPEIRSETPRPHSHPPLRSRQWYATNQTPQLPPIGDEIFPFRPLSLDPDVISRLIGPRPRPSFNRLSSLDGLITFREERAEWRRASSLLGSRQNSENDMRLSYLGGPPLARVDGAQVDVAESEKTKTPSPIPETVIDPVDVSRKSRFRTKAAEVGFCFTMAMTQFLAEYLISGFAIELPKLLYDRLQVGPGTLGLFWPASLLSLILSATLLIFARVSDVFGGYYPFMFGVSWMVIWTLIPGFFKSLYVLDIARAMQGLAIAAFMPSTFTMVGAIYEEGPRRNFVMGLYSGCAPLGFFAGFMVAGALPDDKPQWYLWIASAISAITVITAWLTVPHDKTDRRQLGLKMDYLGAFFITAGLVLLAYALAVEAYANQFDPSRSGFSYPIVYGPFASGVLCLALAFWIEGWYAACPLLPFDFFKPKSVIAFSLAGLCFYASYGVWLYNSASYFQSSTGITTSPTGLHGVKLALWYTPTAVMGLVLCVVGGGILHIVPIMVLLLFSGLAWIGAPLFLAVSPIPLNYWSAVFPSMLCATIGIDLTFTISIVFFSSVQPLKYQGLSGAVCSILVNLAMSFALSISEIVEKRASNMGSFDYTPPMTVEKMARMEGMINRGYQSTFIYAAASAGLGFVICILFVRISRDVVRGQQQGAEDTESQRRTSSEASTLVGRDEAEDARQHG